MICKNTRSVILEYAAENETNQQDDFGEKKHLHNKTSVSQDIITKVTFYRMK